MARNKQPNPMQSQQMQTHLMEATKIQESSLQSKGGTSGDPTGVTQSNTPSNGFTNGISVKSESVKVKQPKRYKVVQGTYIVVNGVRTPLRTGKIIRECDYDIARLKRQGVNLELMPEEPEEQEEQSEQQEEESKNSTESPKSELVIHDNAGCIDKRRTGSHS